MVNFEVLATLRSHASHLRRAICEGTGQSAGDREPVIVTDRVGGGTAYSLRHPQRYDDQLQRQRRRGASVGGAPYKAVGTYGAREVFHDRGLTVIVRNLLLRQPVITELPGWAASQADIAAFRQGEELVVSCHLGGTVKPYPRRLTYGILLIPLRSRT